MRARIAVSIVLAVVSLASAAAAQELPPRCAALARADRSGRFVAEADLAVPGRVDGDDLLARVNRTPGGALPPDYAPADLVDVETMRPARASECVPPRKQCLREEAARAYRALEAAMRAEGMRPQLTSAFRGYAVQCATFLRWAREDGFCAAASASALPGHSQHQLGTSLDLFTRAWSAGGARFREGYGCAPGGRWLRAHAHEYGFVLPYPLHPDYRREGSECAGRAPGDEARIDPRTGYRYEPWHLRYIGPEAAARFRRAQVASGPGTVSEITLEQWLLAERGEVEVRAPVCDGCDCGACATFARDARGPCDRPALRLDARGRPIAAEGPPRVVSVEFVREGARLILRARLEVPDNTLTQPPIVTPRSGAVFARGQRPVRLPSGSRSFDALEGAWRLAIGFGDRPDYWPWRVGLAAPEQGGTANGHNARIPAPPGALTLHVPMEAVLPGTVVRVGVASDGEVRDVHRLIAPEEAP